jgi:aspartyl/asparaginyl beta-hydroxylase (cupin superfamily)
MPTETIFDRRAYTRLSDLMSEARARYKPSELQRVEDAFLMASGQKDSVLSPDLLQRPSFYFPGLTAKPWHNPNDFESVAMLEASYEVIKHELLNLLNKRVGFQPYLEKHIVASGEWNAFYIRSSGMVFEENQASCPETAKVITSLPRIGEMAMFSALNPGAHIKAHCGRWNLRLTIHLGLIVPENCEFRVASEIRSWQEGKCLIFDDSFEHEVWNKSDRTRFCLLVDIWHPDLSPIEIEIMEAAARILREVHPIEAEINEQKNQLQGEQWWS